MTPWDHEPPVVDDEPLVLPTVLIAPDAALAERARDSPSLRGARRLAEWSVGRRVTKSGDLTLAEARRAVQELGLPGDQGPGRSPARSAADFRELTLMWDYAVVGKLLRVDGGIAGKGRALGDLRDGADQHAYETWRLLFDAELDRWLDRPPLDLGLISTMLGLYIELGGVTDEDMVADAIEQHVECSQDHERDQVTSKLGSIAAAMLEELVAALDALGAVQRFDGFVCLTDLGVFGLQGWFESLGGIHAPAVHGLAEATAPQLLEIGRDISDLEGLRQLAGQWVAARGEARAVDELADLAAQGDHQARSIAFALLDMVGEAAVPAVRRLCENPAVRPHAVMWLDMRGVDGPTPTEVEVGWATVDSLTQLLEADAEELAVILGGLFDGQSEAEQIAMLQRLAHCEHPQTAQVLQFLAEHHPSAAVAKAIRKAAMKVRSRPRA